MRRIVRVIPAVVVLSAISLAGPQQDEPRCVMPKRLLSLYLGNWELDRAASDFGIVPGPAMPTYAIDLADGKLHIKAAQKTDTGVAKTDEFSYPLNCSATALTVNDDTLRWPPDLPEAKKSSDDKPDAGAKPPEAPKPEEAVKPAYQPPTRWMSNCGSPRRFPPMARRSPKDASTEARPATRIRPWYSIGHDHACAPPSSLRCGVSASAGEPDLHRTGAGNYGGRE